MENSEETNNIKDLIIKIILIVIIIILILSNLNIIKNGYISKNKDKIPTSNVDIFEIQCEKNSCKVDDNNLTSNNQSSTNPNTSTVTEAEELVVSNSNITWSSTNNLKIFSNPVYSTEEKIAPESSNVYQFVVRNNTKYNVKYSLKFIENNHYDINMKYRLKRGNNYIVGNDNKWVSYNNLGIKNVSLDNSNNHTYYLEWKWVSSNNDTKVGNTLNAGYKLDIKIRAEGTSE